MRNPKMGKVTLVGTGPGDSGLLTLRALKAIEHAARSSGRGLGELQPRWRTRWRTPIARFLASFALLMALAVSSAAQDAERLEHMLTQDCGSCHGLTMRGGLGKPLTHEALANSEAQSIASIILDGVPGTAMPPWRPLLSEADAMWMANYLKTRRTP
jgi:cytochrome c55X